MSALAPKAKYPSFSFAKPGDEFDVTVTQPTEDRQARVYGKDELDWWDDAKTQPVMQTRIVGRAADGIEYAIYPKAGSRMAKAITAAIVAAGADDIEEGSRLRVKFTEYGEGKNPAMPPKAYAAQYTAPAPRSSAPSEDPWADDEPPF
jgi:hypothetical protein